MGYWSVIILEDSNGLVFFLGHPGSGKTTFLNFCKRVSAYKGYSFGHVNDREVFLELTEKIRSPEVQEALLNGEAVTADEFYYEFHARIRAKIVQGSKRGKLLFIELTSHDYEKFLSLYGNQLLGGSLGVLFEAPLATCKERNANRGLDSSSIDDLPIPERYLDMCFAQRSQPFSLQSFFRRSKLVSNDRSSQETLLQRMCSVRDFIFSNIDGC